jgi:Asp/Glu/hydantoin racemase
MCPVPLVRVDEGMANTALRLGERIGVLATLRTTLEPTADLIRNRALATGRNPRIVARVCDGAFERLSANDREGHDELVLHELNLLATDVDVVVLAQASMARVLSDGRAAKIDIPVLSSPELGITYFKSQLQSTTFDLSHFEGQS